jgi:release factor glutamine methyltransferase
VVANSSRAIRKALVSGSASSLPAIVARLRAAGCVFAEDEARLLVRTARTPADLSAMLDRRAAGTPLEYVLGWAEFCGLRFTVEPGVFVPRRRTEFLVQQAIVLARRSACDVIVDLCCGSGAVGAAVSAALNGAQLHAVDVDPVAVRCARRNLVTHGGHAYLGDLYQPLPSALRGSVDLLVVNAPYVPTAEIRLLPAEAREHEPRVALDGGVDGLDVVRRVAAAAPQWLRPGGHLLIETGEHQAAETALMFAASGLVSRPSRSEELNATVVMGTNPQRRC